MKVKQTQAVIIDAVSGLFALAWFFLPITAGPAGSGILLAPWNLPLRFALLAPGSVQGLSLFLVYLVPLYALIKITAFFIPHKLGVFGIPESIFSATARILVTSIMLLAATVPVLKFAESAAWFETFPLAGYIFAGLAAAGNIVSVVAFMEVMNHRNPIYREYKEFKEIQKKITLDESGRKAIFALEVLFRIRTKLFFAFIGIISVILLSLSITLLGNYRETILKAVGDSAKSQVEQASANYRINLGDNIALFEYFNRQVEMNDKAEFRYSDLSLYTNRKEELYLDAPEDAIPAFRAEYSTLVQDTQYPDIAPLDPELVRKYVSLYGTQRSVIGERNGGTGTYAFVSPIIKIDTVTNKNKEKIKRERVLGFSVMKFDEAVIMKPYYMTRNLVIALTAFFMYLSVILTYLVGNYIVNPLLFLRMNVRKISDILASMIRGDARVSSSTLVYNDCVNSRDEIKSLSTEINDMVTVMRGIIPYISASTLKQAEKGTASSTQKELAFLFTDIRGFTTLCEGREPDEVVKILNSYLDLETEIILNNKGDVDKFVGDEMMAFFEGPNKEINACRAAMQIRHAMMEEKERREKEGLPVVSIGIGINTGPVVFGSVGARDRMDFTSIGDTVNLAARLEGANKAYGSKSIITEAVYDEVKEHFLCRELDFIAVKGKNEPVRIYEILQETLSAHPKLLQIKDLFEDGLVSYRKRKWETAAAAFGKNVDKYGDAPSKVYLERIDHFTKNPPAAEWDGVFRMTVK